MKRWDTLADRFLEEYSARGLAESSVAAMRRDLDRWGCWLKSRRPRPNLAEVTSEQITQYIGSWSRFRAKSTQYGMMSRMRQLGDFLVAEHVWRENPLRWMKGPRLDRRHRLPRRLNESTLAQIWEAAAQSRDTFYRHLWVAALGVLYGGGLRRSEVVGLNLSNWDPESGTLLVCAKKTYRERRLPLPDLCRQCMEAYLPRRQNILAKASSYEEPALFVNGRGRRLSKESLSRGIGRLGRRTGEKVTLHQFRHTCASQLLAAGIRLPHVQRLLGHRSIQTTMRYLHVADKELHRAIGLHPINDLNTLLPPRNEE
jgi:site-specific recombinase XerD